VVEGLRCGLCRDVPPQLRDVTLRTLDVGLLQAGEYEGEFEQRLRSVIEEVQASPKPIILFIDEAHTLIARWTGGTAMRRICSSRAGSRNSADGRGDDF